MSQLTIITMKIPSHGKGQMQGEEDNKNSDQERHGKSSDIEVIISKEQNSSSPKRNFC